jgi:hypothetical protein
MAKAIWINSQIQRVIPVDCDGLDDMRRFVGGSICIANTWPSGDVLYVDDEGLLKKQENYFMIEGQPQPLAGDGIIVGPDVDDVDRWWNEYTNVKQVKITWMSRHDAVMWGQAHKDVPSFTVNGVTMQTYGELFSDDTGKQ